MPDARGNAAPNESYRPRLARCPKRCTKTPMASSIFRLLCCCRPFSETALHKHVWKERRNTEAMKHRDQLSGGVRSPLWTKGTERDAWSDLRRFDRIIQVWKIDRFKHLARIFHCSARAILIDRSYLAGLMWRGREGVKMKWKIVTHHELPSFPPESEHKV